jgi:hypothetical protein
MPLVTQPDYVPIDTADRVRPVERLPVPRSWRSERPADVAAPVPPRGSMFGDPGPDLGYGLTLAKRFEHKLELAVDETAEDAVAGCFAVGARRASLFGRAPVIYDMDLAYTLWGFRGGAPKDLILFRSERFRGAAHHYELQRAVAASVREEALSFTAAQIREKLGDWKNLLYA